MADPSIRKLGRPLRLTGYRLVYRAFATTPLEARAEGRFSRQGDGPTTYLSLERRTAARQVAKRWGMIESNRAAYVEFEVPVRLRRVVDLTDADMASQFGVSRQTLTGPDLMPCQALAARLRAAGVEGILTWSSADPEGKNLVIFLDGLDASSSLGPPTAMRSSEERGNP